MFVHSWKALFFERGRAKQIFYFSKNRFFGPRYDTALSLNFCCSHTHAHSHAFSFSTPPHGDGVQPALYTRCALKACANLGDYRQANDLLARMVEENLTPDIVHWNHALRASAACARWQEARLRLQEMKVSTLCGMPFCPNWGDAVVERERVDRHTADKNVNMPHGFSVKRRCLSWRLPKVLGA